MELRQLRYFSEVARTGSFSQASAVLAVAQPALSRQIRKLEQELGIDLLYRHGRGVAPTQAGAQFLAGLDPLLRSLERLAEAASAERQLAHGTIHLGMPPALSAVLGAPLLREVRARLPQVQLRIIDGFSGHVHEWLVSGRVDLAVLHRAQHGSGVETEHLLSEELFLISPPDPPTAHATAAPPGATIGFAELAGLKLILPGQHHGLRRELDRVAQDTGTVLRVEMEVDALGAIKELVMDGAGCAILPWGAIYRECAEGRLVAQRLTEPDVASVMVLAMSLRRPVTLAMREVVRSLRAEIVRLVAAGRLSGKV